MKQVNLKEKAADGMLWSAADKFAVQTGQFVLGIVLARLLMPEDFGLIGMLSIFIAVSQSLVDSGMGAGLVQKKDRSNIDFSTVFVFNLILSLLIYGILYVSAPLIAGFFETPQLKTITRVLTLNIIVNSLSIVQRSRLTINIDFKTIAKVNILSVFTGGIIGVVLAYHGFGVWSLVIQNLSIAVFTAILFFILSRWRPSILFSKQSFRELFGFGSKLLLAGLYAQTIQNIYNITIGKVYPAAALGYYTRSRQFAELTAGTVTSILQQVTFPILASLQDNRIRMASVFGRLIKMSAFFIFPAMALLAMLADPFIRLFLTEKWLPVVSLLQWMCFARVFYPISTINMSILNAMGRSDLFLKVDLAKFPIIVTALAITLPLGVKAVVIGHVVTSILSFFINAYLPGKFMGYGAVAQIRDMIPIIFTTVLMAVAVFFAISQVENLFLKLITGVFVGMVVYSGGAYFLIREQTGEVIVLLKKLLNLNK